MPFVKPKNTGSPVDIVRQNALLLEAMIVPEVGVKTFKDLTILDFTMARPRQLTVGFILGLFLLSVGHSADMNIRERATEMLTSIPQAALLQPPLSFSNDTSGRAKLARTLSRVAGNLTAISGAEAKLEYLKGYTFSTKVDAVFEDPDASDGIEGVDWHRVPAFKLSADIKHGRDGAKKEHFFPSLIVKQSNELPNVKDCLGVHTDGFIPKGTLVGMYGGTIIPQRYGDRLFWARQGSHVRAIGHKSQGHTLDGGLSLVTPLAYYVKNALIGSMFIT